MADHVLLNQARGHALRIVIPHLIQRQIRGNQSGALPQVPLVQAEKQLRIDKAVVHLRPQIIDDLGAEMNNSFINSQLFFCLNERNLRKRSTLISTNLTLNQMRDNYTERVTSRLVEQYVICHFFNSDIRVKKRLQGVVS